MKYPVAIIGMDVETPLGNLESTREFMKKGFTCYNRWDNSDYPYGMCSEKDTASDLAIKTLQAVKDKESLWFVPDTHVYVGELATSNKVITRASDYFKSFNSNVADTLALANGFTGTVQGISSVCCTSLSNIIAGTKAIRDGYAKMAIVGGSNVLDEDVMNFFIKMHLLSKDSCKPLWDDRDGTVLSSGCGLLVLENYFDAQEHGRHVYGTIEGFSEHLGNSRTSSSSSEIYRCMREACFNAIPAVVSMHATGTRMGDEAEQEALRMHAERYGSNAIQKVYTWKEGLGHMLGACGAVETALTVSDSPKGSIACINSVGLNGHVASLCIHTAI